LPERRHRQGLWFRNTKLTHSFIVVWFYIKVGGYLVTVDLEHSTSHADADEKKLHDDHANHWGFFIMNLKGYLEAGMDMRAEKLNQVTM
jgi:hypothetical protein